MSMAAIKKTTDLETKTGVSSKGSDGSDRRLFIISALNLSWQMAIVVLVPIIGGYKLDQKLGSTPGLIILGFIIASVGMAVVLQRQLKAFGPPPDGPPPKDIDD